ncbi:DUF3291 domain-containing protein [Puniceibacterium sediminis]|uniref:DUF3291 domain-containing protein n=1 Tax=Puniceibacterium sediminis TaxID=1608407 RepID=A0A238YTU9_9RHOB|nr:DUF3291 domain-containing protein [Puniceibacterium sediminis]SNR74575.1 protein of unknown function [Puniceibacterium sediminis]
MPRLAFTTFAIMKKPYGDPVVHGFEALTPAVFRKAEESAGFIARAREIDDRDELTNFERDWGPWGKFAVPRFYDGGFETAQDTRASTVSLWASVDAVRQFAYSGLHQRALQQREKWFRKPAWPTYAMWWVDDAHTPSWGEACQRLEHLHDYGPSAYAFDFSQVFAAQDRTPEKVI